MDGDYRDSDGGPWTECAGCGATIAYDPDAWDDEGRYHDQYCAECVVAEMAAGETDEGG